MAPARHLKVAFTVLLALSMAMTGAFLLTYSAKTGYVVFACIMGIGAIVLGGIAVRMFRAPEASIESAPRTDIGMWIVFAVLFVPLCWWIFGVVFHLGDALGN